MQQDKKFNIKSLKFYLETSIKGVALGVVSFLCSHPAEVLKIKLQSESIRRLSLTQEIKDIYVHSGLKGYYKGCIPNLIKYSARNIYRWPLMMYLPAFYNQYASAVHSKLLTALTLGNLESVLFSPFERLKTFLVTQSSRTHPIYYFFKNNKFKEYYRGLVPSLYKQNVTWLSFLYFDYEFKKFLVYLKSKRSNDNVPIKLDFIEINIVSLMVAICNTIFTLPFDYVKTNAQKESFIQINGVMRFLYTESKNYGILILYSGWRAKLLHYVIQATFNVHLLYYLEQKTHIK